MTTLRPPLGVRARLTLAMTAVIAVTCGCLGWLLTRGELAQVEALVATHGQGLADYLARNAEREMLKGDAPALVRLAERITDQRGTVHVHFFDRHGTRIAAVDVPPEPDRAPPIAPREFHASVTTLREHGSHGRSTAHPDATVTREVERIGTVAVAVSSAGFDQLERTADIRTLCTAFAVALLGIGAAMLVVRRALPRVEDAAADPAVGPAVAEHDLRTITDAFHALAEGVAALQRRIDAQVHQTAPEAGDPARPLPM